MPEHPIDPELAAVSSQLGGLAPRPAALDRDRLLYEAGRRSVRRSRLWPAIAGMFAILSVDLGVRLAYAPPRTEIVYVTKVADENGASKDEERSASVVYESDSEAYVPGSPGYVGLRNQVVRFGADSLPSMHGALSQPRSPDESVEMMLGLPRGTLDDAQKSRWQHQLF
jgi:hypothetical protein